MGKVKQDLRAPKGRHNPQSRSSIRPHRKILLLVILLLVVAAHTALFIAGGSWRTLAFILLAMDAVSGMMVIGALRESRKLENSDGK